MAPLHRPGNGTASASGDPSRLSARPRAGAAGAADPGTSTLGLSPARDGLLHVPPPGQGPTPLVVVFHGAGGDAADVAGRLIPAADRLGFAVLAPDSRGGTWDVIRGGFGPDVAFLDRALAHTFGLLEVDPRRIAVAGFSDGASYALSIGLANGDLFDTVLAWAPGFLATASRQRRPRVFVSHGTRDQVLPIDVTSRRLVPRLRADGYEVRYAEFDGGHVLLPALVEDSLAWWLDPPG